jgi:hypothetical protein
MGDHVRVGRRIFAVGGVLPLRTVETLHGAQARVSGAAPVVRGSVRGEHQE